MWNPFKKKTKSEKRESGPEESGRTKEALYAYTIQGPAGFPGTVVSLSSDEELKRRIRQEAKAPGLDVVVIPPKEWNAPEIRSLDQQGLSSIFPLVMDRAMTHMAEAGLPYKDPQELIRAGAVMPHPLTGLVFFVYRVDQPVEPEETVRPAAGIEEIRAAGDAERLIGILKGNPESGAREAAATALKELDDISAVPALIDATRDAEPGVRLAAVAALDTMGDNRALDAFYERLTGDEDNYKVFLASVIALGNLQDRRAVHALLQVLEVDDGALRSAAAGALGKIGDQQAVAPLIRCLEDEDAVVRMFAAGALGELREPKVIPNLLPLLEDEDEKVREKAESALEMLESLPQRHPPASAGGDEGKGDVPSGVPDSIPEPAEPDEPVFVGRKIKGKNVYETYEAGTAVAARAFLDTQEVDKPFHYVAVKTPEGIWGKDKEGLYLVRLLDWQTDLSLGECEGAIVEMPSLFGLQNLKEGILDNVVVRVACGRCGHQWNDGVRFTQATVVRCPACGAYNTVEAGDQVLLP